jgi:hypothetical protein
MTVSEERPRLLVLDLLESYAREPDMHVVLARMTTSDEWICRLTDTAGQRVVGGTGETARAAIMDALREEGIELPH